MRRFTGAILLLLTAMAACSQFTVRERHDPSADFGRLRTWSWQARSEMPWDRRLARDSLDVRIEEETATQLAAKAYRQVTEDPDFRVNYHVAVGPREALQGDPHTYGYLPGYWDMGVYAYDEGSLFIDVIDARTNTLLWRGVASTALRTTSTLKERRARITEAVQKVLSIFPPKK